MPQLILVQIFQGLDTFLNIVEVALIVYALMTWFMRPDNAIYRFFATFADFILTPFRPISNWLIEKGFRIDMSVVIALLAIEIIRKVLTNILISVI